MAIACSRCHSANPSDSKFCSKCGAELIAKADELTVDQAPVSLPAPPQALPGELSAGTILRGKYRILGELARGGMGVVYTAEDLKLKRTVALKFLSPELTCEPEARERFVHEAQAASELDHPNICTVHEIDETEGGQMYIAMAYYRGESLRERIKRGPLGVEEAVGFAVQLASGLEKAHARGIIHRDIKPANILLTEDGLVKIVDFGLARLARGTRVTKTGTTMGTVAYMSPEQAQGQDLDQRTDLWSAGVVLYEMLTGRLPFKGEREVSVLYSIVHEEPQRLKSLKPEVPPEVDRIVGRALEKKPQARYSSAGEMLKDLEGYQESLRIPQARPLNLRLLLRQARRPRVAIPVLIFLLALCVFGRWFLSRQAKIRWAREQALPEIERIIEENDVWRNLVAAYTLAEKAEAYIPRDPKLAELFSKCSLRISIKTKPPGVKIYMKEYRTPESDWKYLGVSPLEKIRVPIGIFRWKMEKEGYETVLAASSTWDVSPGARGLAPYDLVRVLDKEGSIPPGMVRVPGTQTERGDLPDFYMDKFEVTNRRYREFINSGGYRNRKYWKQKFTKEGRELSWEKGVKEFTDQSGQPGPATWQAGDYPEGQGDYPVSGISWYEAGAYAEFVGKSLPTRDHWGVALGTYTPLIEWPQLGGFAVFAPFSNFKHKGPLAVGSLQGITAFGAFDMAGNVREWCWNETPKGRLLRGGAWDDNSYMFDNLSQAPPMDRSYKNGFRCALYPDFKKIPEAAFQLATPAEAKDFHKERPVADPVFQVYKDQFSYDKTDLKARVESRQENKEGWILEKVTLDAAYGNERVIAYLFLPTNAAPPYQTVVYFPGSESINQKSSQDLESYYEFTIFLSFIVKNGRAVLYPVYKGTFERGNDTLAALEFGDGKSHQYTELFVQQVKDLRRCVDYLETRHDIDAKKLAYYGMSWGSDLGAIIPAVEDRIKASVLVAAGLGDFGRPEVAQINYVTRVKVPTLILDGKYDTLSPYETSQKPMFDLLGTPPEHKQLKSYETDHIPPRNEFVKETLAWLDRYLGAVK